MSNSRVAAVLSRKGIFLQRLLGEGAFGKVFEVELVNEKNNFAAKLVDCERLYSAQARIDYINLKREVNILQKLKHRNIISLHSVVNISCYVVIMMELCDCSLKDFLAEKGAAAEGHAMAIFQQCVSGVSYIHSLDIAHRDIKPANILQSDMNVKLADFNIAMECRDKDTGQQILATDYCGSPGYTAPEVLRHLPYDAITADVWSLGILLYQLLTNRLPTQSWKNESQACLKPFTDILKILIEPDEHTRLRSAANIQETKPYNLLLHKFVQ